MLRASIVDKSKYSGIDRVQSTCCQKVSCASMLCYSTLACPAFEQRIKCDQDFLENRFRDMYDIDTSMRYSHDKFDKSVLCVTVACSNSETRIVSPIVATCLSVPTIFGFLISSNKHWKTLIQPTPIFLFVRPDDDMIFSSRAPGKAASKPARCFSRQIAINS